MHSESTSVRPRGRPPRTSLDVEAARSRIAAVAIRLFREEGYASVSMRRLAQEAGCTTATLYAYFASKTDILGFLWAEVFRGLFAALRDLAADHHDARERLGVVAGAYVRFWIDHPDTYRMVFMTEGVAQPDVAAFLDDGDTVGRFALFFDTMREAWHGRDTAWADGRTQALLCGLQGVAHNLITVSGYGWSPAETLVDTLVQALLPPRLPLWVEA